MINLDSLASGGDHNCVTPANSVSIMVHNIACWLHEPLSRSAATGPTPKRLSGSWPQASIERSLLHGKLLARICNYIQPMERAANSIIAMRVYCARLLALAYIFQLHSDETFVAAFVQCLYAIILEIIGRHLLVVCKRRHNGLATLKLSQTSLCSRPSMGKAFAYQVKAHEGLPKQASNKSVHFAGKLTPPTTAVLSPDISVATGNSFTSAMLM